MKTLQDLKNLIEAVENDLNQKGIAMSDVPIQKDFMNGINEISIDVNDYLGHIYAQLIID